jgi:hypothetical protein
VTGSNCVLHDPQTVIVTPAQPERLEGFAFVPQAGLSINQLGIDLFAGSIIVPPNLESLVLRRRKIEGSMYDAQISEHPGFDVFRGEDGKNLIKLILGTAILAHWNGETCLMSDARRSGILYLDLENGERHHLCFRHWVAPSSGEKGMFQIDCTPFLFHRHGGGDEVFSLL